MSKSKQGYIPYNVGKTRSTGIGIELEGFASFRSINDAADFLNVKPNTLVKAATDKKIKRKVKKFTILYLIRPEFKTKFL